MTPSTIYRTYRRTSFFRRRRFLMFWTIKLTFITFACNNQYFVVDWSRRVFTGEKVNWPAAFSWITLDSHRYMAKISAAAYLRMRLISEYIRYISDRAWSRLGVETAGLSEIFRNLSETRELFRFVQWQQPPRLSLEEKGVWQWVNEIGSGKPFCAMDCLLEPCAGWNFLSAPARTRAARHALPIRTRPALFPSQACICHCVSESR